MSLKKEAIGVMDLGASGGRVFVVTRGQSGLMMDEVHRFNHGAQVFRQKSVPGKAPELRLNWNLGAIYEGMLEGLRRIAGIKEIELKSFGIDTWGSDGVWMTAAGDILGMLGTGRDERWQKAQAEIFAKVSRYRIFKSTGALCNFFAPLNQIYWYCRHQPLVVKSSACYMPLASLLSYYLCGARAIDTTWASAALLHIHKTRGYNASLFKKLGLPVNKMPRLVKPGTKIGVCHPALARELGLNPFQVIMPGVHDTASAFAAASVANHASIVISSGTWFLTGLHRPTPIVSTAAFREGFSNIGGYEDFIFLKGTMGSWPAQELKRLWSIKDGKKMAWEVFNRLVMTEKSKIVLDIDNPLFFNTTDMQKTIQSYCRKTGQKIPTTRRALARAVSEGMALGAGRACRQLCKITGLKPPEIVFIGGATKNRILLQWLADITGLRIRTGPEDATSFGNALGQAKALGWIKSLEEGRRMLPHAAAVYKPSGSHDWEMKMKKLEDLQYAF